MTDKEVDRIAQAAVAAPGRIGQSTVVEQSRAVAEVQAAIVVAQQRPRDVDAARTAMQLSCQQQSLAEKAFYSYRRGPNTIAGASIHLARELARCWGNIQHGIAELRRDDEYGESEMQAWAWDLEANYRVGNTFIVPHKRDRTGGPVKLVDLRDIYENNANSGARRLREAIFAVLPPWFRDEAEQIAHKTLEEGDGRKLEDRIAGAVKVFDALGVTIDRLETKLGRPQANWSGHDIAQLLITHKSIRRGELAIDEAFPQPRVTAEELTGQSAEEPPAADPDNPLSYADDEINERGAR